MYAESQFYQITGFRAHSNGWFKMYDDKPIVKEIMAMDHEYFRPAGKDAPVELVLGVRPSGASYLLMSNNQMHVFTREHHLRTPDRKPWTTRDFVSLSPIYFSSLEALSAKVAKYKQRPRNKNRREAGEELLDNSQANRGYVQKGPEVAHYRGYFEQQRTLYRLITRKLEPGKVGLAAPPWLGGIRVVSLVFEEWMADKRRRADRLNNPLLVDIGWTDVHFPTFFEWLTGAAVHFKLKSSAKMINPGSKGPRFSVAVEHDEVELNQRLRTLLSKDADASEHPLVVLVHDEDMARTVLSRAGIDLQGWSSGLSNLLPFAPVKNRFKVEEETSNPSGLPRPSIVDMQKLVKAVMETNAGHTVPYSAKVLHMQTDAKTCAGDDSLLMLHMWTSMAQGLAIDEQHEERSSHEPTRAQVLAPPSVQAPANADADPNDVDPNDMPPGPGPTIADDFSSDDDW